MGKADWPEPMELSDAESRALGHFAAACAQEALPVYAREVPGDDRPSEAVAAAAAWAAGERTGLAVRTAGWRAYTAGMQAPSAMARHAAMAAARAAVAPFPHPLARDRLAESFLYPAAHAARARALADGDDPAVAAACLARAAEIAGPVVVEILLRVSPAARAREETRDLLWRLDRALREGQPLSGSVTLAVP